MLRRPSGAWIRASFKLTFAAWIAISLSGCTTTAKPDVPCPQLDWFEAGRRDGSEGRAADHASARTRECGLSGKPVDGEAYINGWNAGLTEYCSVPAGVAAGRSGQMYFKVCPAHLEKAFLEGYDVGVRIHAMEAENTDLARRIDSLFRVIGSTPLNQELRPQMREQLEDLRKRRAQNDSRITDAEKSAGSGIRSF